MLQQAIPAAKPRTFPVFGLVRSAAVIVLFSATFVFGAAVVQYKLPPFELLDQAFRGGKAKIEQKMTQPKGRAASTASLGSTSVDVPGKTFDGFTLYTTDEGSEAVLVDMNGTQVHKWDIPLSNFWKNPPHIKSSPDDAAAYVMSCHLFTDGSLLAILQAKGDTPYGYGLVKIGVDSRVEWKCAKNIHHDMDVDEEGTIYAIDQHFAKRMPTSLQFVPTPALVDSLVVISKDGEVIKSIPVLETLWKSSFRQMVSPLEGPALTLKGDVLHTNYVQVLRKDMAANFPRFRAGQVLVSVRELDCIMMVDVESEEVVWATVGPWRYQHSPQFLDSGRLLIFDNRGNPRASRAIEYDIETHEVPWSYTDEDSPDFFTRERGMCQRLPNGNTLIVDSEGFPNDKGRILEVTHDDKKLVWSITCNGHIAQAKRYAPDAVPFLKEIALKEKKRVPVPRP
jgi:hypothetical protein